MAGEFGAARCDGWTDVSRNHLVAFLVTASKQVSINKQWKQVDHELFILAVALDPFTKMKLFNLVISRSALCGMLQRVYMRVLGTSKSNVPVSLILDFRAYPMLGALDPYLGMETGRNISWHD